MYPQSVVDRVSKHLSAFSNEKECWIWPMSKTAAGYGQLSYVEGGRSRLAYAHRAAFEIAHGHIAPGMHVCHKCDNPSCFNSSHLFLGTPKDNTRDMWAKGRQHDYFATAARGDRHGSRTTPGRIPKGEANKKAKLTCDDVKEILNSSETGLSLAKKFNVTAAAISAIRTRKTWTHVG